MPPACNGRWMNAKEGLLALFLIVQIGYIKPYCSTSRPLRGCTGLLLGWCITALKASIWAWLTCTGCFITSQRTPSEQGGVVREPLKR